MRRVLITVAIVIVLIGGGAGAYFYFFSGKPGLVAAPPSSATLPSSGATASVPPAASANSTNTPTVPATRVAPRLVRIAAGPVVPGVAVIATSTPATGTASSTPDAVVKYIERQSGNVYTYSLSSGVVTRTSNRTLPGIEEAQWLPDGSAALVRYLSGDSLSTIETYGLLADGSNGFFLPQGLSDVAVSSSGILLLASGANGSVGSLARLDGTSSSNVFTSPLSSLRALPAGKGQYVAFTKPSESIPGYLFLVDAKGRFSRLEGPLPGLVALASPSGKKVLVSYAQNGVLRMELVDTVSRAVTALPLATIADKCAWTSDDSALYCGVPLAPPTDYSYPDDWYQGALHFSDRIWKIDVAGRFAQLVLNPSANTIGALDAEALSVNQAGNELVFVNKNDGSLWGYQL